MPSTKVQKTSIIVTDDDRSQREQVQYRTTVPRMLSEEFDLEGVRFDWDAKSKDRFELIRF